MNAAMDIGSAARFTVCKHSCECLAGNGDSNRSRKTGTAMADLMSATYLTNRDRKRHGNRAQLHTLVMTTATRIPRARAAIYGSPC
eukprot:775747-Pelagomonas_calceolata.AAC.1